ncbi:WHAT'S THIS FACTOR 1-like protein [Thalictrum thalictroides]|uniref:WHAT'S THIS FACTOR 1-like protein n=1 Tax=Thalictrum thalictroides TaxID=46969 RepID=A0A7J6W479_THATH|nr:WHAT'S THIS FACTOR 1-like protein [Thalictrum thalictroides]
MDSKLLFSSPRISSSTPISLFLSYPSASFIQKSNFSVKSHFSISSKLIEKTSFWGKSLVLEEKKQLGFGNLRKTHFPFQPIRAVVKRRKELPFDNVIQRDKKLKLVMKIRRILVSQPDRTMSLRELGKFRRELGLTRKRRFIALLKRFPAVFEIVEEGVYSLKFKLTPEAERLYMEELKIRNEMEDLVVIKLRKLLMMSLEKRIHLDKIAHLMHDLGLPQDFRDTVCQRYPQYFKVVATERGPALELTHWDPELAVSAAEISEEENQARETEERNLIIDRPPKFNRVKLPRGLNLSKGEMRRIMKFREIPYISPYSDFSELRAGTNEKEKHACGVVHEILSLTIEKRTLVDHLTHFRDEFRFSQQLRGMLIRHPDMFYVSLKGERDSVFLREAYRDSQLIDKDRSLIIKERFRALVAVPRYRGRSGRQTEMVGGDETEKSEDRSEEENDEQWSDEDDEDYDDDGDGDDGEDVWSDEDDETPPVFDDAGGSLTLGQSKRANRGDSRDNEDRVLEPAFPDGRPRERW